MALSGNLVAALLWIIIGAVFDFFDGMVARLLHVSSPIGKELDSLADVVTFGVAPSMMVFYELNVIDYPATMETWRDYVPYVAFLIAAFSALRLAKFNLDTRQTSSFIGLPTPANALFWGSLLAGMPQLIENRGSGGLFLLLVLTALSCWLLVSELPMFALKFKHWGLRGNEVKYGFVVMSAALLLTTGLLLGFWMVIVLYVAISVVLFLTGKSKPE